MRIFVTTSAAAIDFEPARIGVAAPAIYSLVATGKREERTIMVKRNFLPAGRAVAAVAIISRMNRRRHEYSEYCYMNHGAAPLRFCIWP